MNWLFLILMFLNTHADSTTKKYMLLIKAEMIKNDAIFQKCYKDALKEDNQVEGKLVVDFFINSDGTTKDINLNKKRSKLLNDTLFNCLKTAISTINFPKTENGTGYQNSFPFKFRK